MELLIQGIFGLMCKDDDDDDASNGARAAMPLMLLNLHLV